MRYIWWAVLALVGYTLVAPLVKLATVELPSEVALFIGNGILLAVAGAVILSSNTPFVPYLTHPRAVYAYGAGVALSVGILSYYRALAMGPVSVVVPVFGLFIVTSSIVGIAALDEPLTARKVAGVALAIVAIYLTAVE